MLGHGASIVWNGLVLYLDAANTKSYPGSGTSCLDLSSNNRNATLLDGTTYDSVSFVFDGIANRLNGSNTSTIKWSADGVVGYQTMTISLWVKSTDTVGNYFSSPWNASGQYNIQIGANSFIIFCGSAGSSASLTFDTSLRDGKWKNLVCWMDATNMGYYLNSSISASKAHGLTGNIPTAGNSNVQICLMSLFPYNSGWAGNTNFSIAGNMAVCSIYSRVLSSTEVSQNFEAMRGRYGV